MRMMSSGVMAAVVITVGWLMASATAILHKVGGKQGWNQNVNYTEWAANEQVYVGEWLIFNFDKRYYNVLEVNKTSYENCNDQGFIRNITRGGRDVYQITEARPYYFLSGGGYCWHGMKLYLTVHDGLPPAPELAPALSPATSVSSPPNLLTSSAAEILILSIAFSWALMWTFSLATYI